MMGFKVEILVRVCGLPVDCNQVSDSRIRHKGMYSHHNSKGSGRSLMSVPIPLEPLKDGHRIEPQERVFLEAAERGDKATMMRCLSEPNKVNINCTNILGRSAIQIAVDNENIEIVELLLSVEGVKIGDALLYAIREGVYRIVEMLIDHPTITTDMLGMDWGSNKKADEESPDYPSDISPIILAAHCNQFEILQLLLSRGAKMDKPHSLTCSCARCKEELNRDSLRHSLRRIHTYRALASPAWISLTSSDPILTAFKLSWELEQLSMRENEYKDTYMELSDSCKRYACDLLDMCRSSEEVIAVLNKDSHNDNNEQVDLEQISLTRLKLALKYEQKQFVAHPHCQQLLASIWYAGVPGWRKHNSFTKFLTTAGLILIIPFMALYYLFLPHTKIGQMLRSPFMKFLYHSASFGVFLILLTMASTQATTPDQATSRGPSPSFLEWMIMFYVTGFVWAECKQLWEEGLKAYIRQWWNWLDFIMLSLYLCTFSLRLVAYFLIESGNYGPKQMKRKDWPESDPTLIAEGLFAVANVFSFARTIYLFQANPHLGPLQISLGCMLIDIAKFMFIFFLVLVSFACGMNQLYSYYTPPSDGSGAFYKLDQSVGTLIWSLFGLTQKKDIQIEDGKAFTMQIGELMFMVYHALAIVVLVNMLIAMMSSSFQDIEAHADREWKFARTKLWISYFDEGSTLPTPFNILISPKSIYYCLKSIKRFVDGCICSEKKDKIEMVNQHRPAVKTISTGYINGDSNTYQAGPHFPKYQDVMRCLVSRYILQTKKQSRQDGVNEDDLLEIKQDISSLRYELREDRKRESAFAASHIDGLKRDIILALRANPTSKNLSPGFCSPLPSPTPGSRSHSPNIFGDSTQSPHGHTVASISPKDLETLKHELVMCLRQELREIAYDIASSSNMDGGNQNTGVVPPPYISTTNSELYHTHLYTQL